VRAAQPARVRRDRGAETLARWRLAEALLPADPFTHYLIGDALADAGETAAAAAHLAQAVDLQPGYAAAERRLRGLPASPR
jgi:Flp pilus assembly protein TadD